MVIVVDASPRLARIGRAEDPDHVVSVAGDEEGGTGCVGSGSAKPTASAETTLPTLAKHTPELVE